MSGFMLQPSVKPLKRKQSDPAQPRRCWSSIRPWCRYECARGDILGDLALDGNAAYAQA